MIKKWIIVLLIPLSGCYYDIESELYPNACPPPEVVSFSTDIQPLVQSSCAKSGCHDGQSGQSPFNSYQEISSKAGSIKTRAVHLKDMPPAGQTPLNPCEIQLLRIWIDEGAPNN